MPGAVRSDSSAIRGLGALIAPIAVVGYLTFGWSFNGSANTIPTAISIIVAVSAIGWMLYSSVYSDGGS